MSWLQKLGEVYDMMIGTEGCGLLPVGMIFKKIKYNIILSSDGKFITAQQLPKDAQVFAVPTTPQAEGRTSAGVPFPLADQLKYLVTDGEQENKKFEMYVEQLSAWCSEPDAPECLRVLCRYLRRRTLLDDLLSVPELKLRRDGDGISDSGSMACFSVQDPDGESRLWMRGDVRESWLRRAEKLLENEPKELCFATGQLLPVLRNHPKLSGNAKLISSLDAGFPFQFKGRFTDSDTVAAVSGAASLKAHNALRWLLEYQGFQRYGMSIVAWNTAEPELKMEEDIFEDEPQEKRVPNTFEPYALALRDAAAGYMEELRRFRTAGDLTDEARQRMNEIVILGMQAATDGRMSVTYYQEIPGNLYVQRLDAWADACFWEMPGKGKRQRTPTWDEICEAVLGRDTVELAKRDMQCTKSATKQMREMQLRLLNCVVNGRQLPKDFLQQSFRRAVQPLRFTDRAGKWDNFTWARCVAVSCALYRAAEVQSGRPAPEPILDTESTEWDYLYGRLLAAAHMLETEAAETRGLPTNALRLMARFAEKPGDTWLHLYKKLLPSLKRIGKNRQPEKSGYLADRYLRLFGEIERQFLPEDRQCEKPLSYAFLVGFSAQLRELYLKSEEEHQKKPELLPFAPPQGRDALYGCLLAVADVCEWKAEAEKVEGIWHSRRDGQTNAMLLTASYIAEPSSTWAHVHDKMIPYLEKSGVAAAKYLQSLICRAEQGFTVTERQSKAPLTSMFLNGYLSMRLALRTKDGLDTEVWTPLQGTRTMVDTREAAFGALLSLENAVERWALDREKNEDENRPSNAMRFLPRAAQRPNEVTAYLMQRMRPYAKKLSFPGVILRERERLIQQIAAEKWNTDAPLGPEYLHTFYTYRAFAQTENRKERG